MRRKLTAIVLTVATAAALAAVAAAGPVTAKQRVELQIRGNGSFVLAPMTSGAVKRDTGTASFCCWTEHQITRDGITNDVDDPHVTLFGKRGNLMLHNRIEFFDILDGWTVITGTWKVVGGTGAYAGISGGGHGAGVMLAPSNQKTLFQGFLSAK
jgi:hypothetical protein